nr:MAG TPA: hypothetical protein [Caudoviricetes sp.]
MKLAGDAPWGTWFVIGSALAGLTATPTTRSPVEALRESSDGRTARRAGKGVKGILR